MCAGNRAEVSVEVIVYSRKKCCLCDEAKAVIEGVAEASGIGIALQEVDIDDDPELRKLYTNEVPVVFVGGKKAFKYRVDAGVLRGRLERAAGKLKEGES